MFSPWHSGDTPATLFYDLMCIVLLGLVQVSLHSLCGVHVDIHAHSVCTYTGVCPWVYAYVSE